MSNKYSLVVQGIDVTDFLIAKPSLTIDKGDLGQLVQIPDISLLMDNELNSFTPGATTSIFTTGFRGDSVTITEDGILIYAGEIRNVRVEGIGNRVTIDATAKVNRILGKQVPGFQQTTNTLAELSKDLYILYGIEYDPISYGRAQEQQELLLLQARANVSITSESTLLQLQEWLAKTGFCRHYFIGNTAFMDYESMDDNPIIVATFTDDQIIDVSNYGLIETDAYDGYEVITSIGTARKAGNIQAPSLNAYLDQDFIIDTVEAGYNWGDYQIRLSERELYGITIKLANGDYTSWLTLNSTFGVNSAVLGINKQFQVLSIDNSSLLGPVIRGQSI